MSYYWTEAEDAAIRAAVQQGESAAVCAGRLTGRTRSAVTGRARRLGLTFSCDRGQRQRVETLHRQREEARAQAAEIRRGALAVRCWICRAEPGEPCTSVSPHPQRIRAAAVQVRPAP